ncbi:uncharacterized protein LOC121249626 [Juglans microcarpa x Juglans regia]|uniref:uncharacterized protein LOC121249626 n=1 Tax=Juglans microcarpa x Juglans regia TaxID=2249226 RepID=UPI001B7E9D70|nr:uncharacterized protein LOC121249626 [Juglans microcarpa x Juglans regia]
MKKASISPHNLGVLQSPGAPSYRDKNAGSQRGWSSERVPLTGKSSRRHLSAASLMPFNSGRALPSKWDDAERWICSPISGQSNGQVTYSQPHKRPKSKSGPIVPPGVGCSSNYSPAMQGLDGSSLRSFLVGSPLSAGILAADGLFVQYGNVGVGQSFVVDVENSVAHSGCLPGWSELLSEPSSPSSQDEKLDGTEETMDSRAVSRRDMATQMSPEGGINSSPRANSSFSSTPPSFTSIVETQAGSSTKVEVKDVQVDKRATVINWSKKHIANMTKKRSPHVEDFNNDKETRAASWDIAEAEMNISKLQREEAKIAAWESLQKAKAEAEIRKLEMKLEKKRSSSMDKILSKLSMAQMKAQKMRSAVSVQEGDQDPKTFYKVVSFRKFMRMGSFRSCFTSHDF